MFNTELRAAIESHESLTRFTASLSDNRFAAIDNGELKLGRMEAAHDQDTSVRGFLQTVLPKVRIEDLLLDVHRRCGFLVHPRIDDQSCKCCHCRLSLPNAALKILG